MNAVAKIEKQSQVMAPVSESAALLSVIERAASNPEVDVDKMERLMQMHEKVLARQAEQAFNDAMNLAQAEIGRVAADKSNSQTHSDYASYAALDRMVRPVYTRHGFSLSFGTEAAAEGVLVVLAHVSHAAGHTRLYRVPMPADGKGAKGGDVMTKTHATGSAMTYGQRYLLKLIFNVAIGVDPDDDDGNGADTPIDPSWHDAINGATGEAELRKVKADMLATWKAVENVPRVLVEAYKAKLVLLRSAKNG